MAYTYKTNYYIRTHYGFSMVPSNVFWSIAPNCSQEIEVKNGRVITWLWSKDSYSIVAFMETVREGVYNG